MGKIFLKSNENIYSELESQLLDWFVPIQEHNLDAAALKNFLKRRPIQYSRLDGSAVEETHNMESDNFSR